MYVVDPWVIIGDRAAVPDPLLPSSASLPTTGVRERPFTRGGQDQTIVADAALPTAYGVNLVSRVAQLAPKVRVLPQDPIGSDMSWDNVQVWAMYSDAIQTLVPSVSAAP